MKCWEMMRSMHSAAGVPFRPRRGQLTCEWHLAAQQQGWFLQGVTQTPALPQSVLRVNAEVKALSTSSLFSAISKAL